MKFLSRYSPRYISALLYMLQTSEYRGSEYRKWLRRVNDFRTVNHRNNLHYTAKASLLAVVLWGIALVAAAGAIMSIVGGFINSEYLWVVIGALLLLVLPWVLAYSVLVPLWLGQILIQGPKERRILATTRRILDQHKGIKIAIVGSYGKTTAKEILRSVFAQGKNVAATPGNLNTPLGISSFVRGLSGDEEVLIFEFGESHIGDIKELSELTGPDIGVITGISEAHLETFGTVDNIISTIFELEDFLGKKPLYKNGDSGLLQPHLTPDDPYIYTVQGMGKWKVHDPKVLIDGTQFTMTNGKHEMPLRISLLGQHNIGIVTAAAAIADSLGLTEDQIVAGIGEVKPFDHRMQPRLLHGAWIVDDTYNGNSEGVRAGLSWLAEVPAKRRIYVTPGLVEQGDKTAEIHEMIGHQAADVADIVILMHNSTTPHIKRGLESASFKGEVRIIEDPLSFYQNLDQFVVAGDVVLMQNDWTDNYA